MTVTTENRAQRARTTLVGGLLAGLVMGVVLHAATPVMSMIGMHVGVPTALGGWAVHLALSLLFAVGFVALLSMTHVTREVGTALDTALLGVAYGGLLGLVSWGFVIPGAVAAGASFPLATIPGTVETLSLGIGLGVAHLAYGLVLGLVVGVRHQPAPRVSRVLSRG